MPATPDARLGSHPCLVFGGFWSLVLILNMGPQWELYTGPAELLMTSGLTTTLQFLVATVTTRILVKHLLLKHRMLLFVVSLLAVAIVAAECWIFVRYYFLEPGFPDTYRRFLAIIGERDIVQRTISPWALKNIMFAKVPMLLYPTAIILAHFFYQRQTATILLKEEKQRAELAALKNQLNPHFIFNTLNSLYSLTLKKSDKAAVVIEKLADILDYVIYRAHEDYVLVRDETELLKSYIDLETIRYGDRLTVVFRHSVQEQPVIAPLLLLSLVENAFKHGVKEAVGEAKVEVDLEADNHRIGFTVRNTRPPAVEKKSGDNRIGNRNLRQQLDILYPGCHELEILELPEQYTIKLTIEFSSNPHEFERRLAA